LRPPRVPTDVGVTRETPGGAQASKSRAPIVLAFVGVVALCAVGGVVVVRQRATTVAPVTHDQVDTHATATVIAAPPPQTAQSVAAPTASLEPLPSATSAPSSAASTVSVTNSSPGVVPATAASKARVPQNLNGVQPHF
jgi:hypothetical protein